MNKTQKLYKQAKKIIPGGTQLLSKRPEMFLPGLWPAYYEKAKGCEVWDLDGKKYVDMSLMGIGSCILGYADEDINRAVKKAIDQGSMSTLNAPEEVALAKLLVKLHPWAQMIRYARGGGEAMSIAVRIARASAGKDLVLFCGYHGWHDWYLSSNLASNKALDGHLLPGLSPRGVPRKLKGTAYPFRYNDVEGFLKLVKRHKKNIGVIVLESIRNKYPSELFLSALKKAAKELNIVLVVDEVSAGFRLNLGGAHLLFGLEPDIAVFAKGMSNGFPMAAIIGKSKVMQAAQDTFISSTYWTDRIGPVAALTAIKKMQSEKVILHLQKVGKIVQEGWRNLASKHGLKIKVDGIYPLGHFSFQYARPMVLKTIFTQEMLERGFLASNAFYASYAHKEAHLVRYLRAVDEVFGIISRAITQGRPEKYLKAGVCHSGFKRLT